jgi:hypothetical protein
MADVLRHHQRHDPTNQGMVSAPHGPETGTSHEHLPTDASPQDEARMFHYLLFPDDLYTPEGVYWADLPILARRKFVTGVDNAEAAKELSTIGSMMKKDPLSPIAWYFRNAVLPGAGLGLEGYVAYQLGVMASS